MQNYEKGKQMTFRKFFLKITDFLLLSLAIASLPVAIITFVVLFSRP
jgi:hypothetical protein